MSQSPSTVSPVFGRLSLESLPIHEPILVGTFVVVALGGFGILALLTRYRLWGWLWREWLTSVDHKIVGLVNYVMPLQIGARDVAFPFLNSLSLWLTVAGAVLVMVSLFIGEFSTAGWLNYVPVSNIQNSPGTGPDYYLWGLQIAGIGTTLSSINMVTTIFKMRAPGMTLMKMPVFTWTALCSNVLAIAIFPVLTGAFALLMLDRYVGTNFFTNDLGGNAMMYWNLVWIWGHPEVYVLVLPVFGIYSEITSTFSGKRLFGYSSMVYATVVITILSYLVWLHHFFTMGSGASVNSFFGIATMVIAIPTGAKIFNWLFTMYRGRIRYDLPMMWVVAFMITFVVGGMTGVMLAIPPADFVLHNSLFLVAHFHNVIIGGVVFGLFAGMTYWFPKAFGFRLDPFWGHVSFWGWVIGYWVAWTPIYIVGLMGTTRRVRFFEDPTLQPWFIIAGIGALIILVGILAFVIQIAVSIKNRDKLRDTSGDPWGGRTLEWSTASPPPHYNFALTPVVHELDAWYDMKARGHQRPAEGFRPVHMPRSTGAGVIISGLALILGFAMVWYIWWLAALSFAAILIYSILFTFDYDRTYYIPVSELAADEKARRAQEAGA
jgi:cytochrome o ubiquinol oxidase subunit 1